MRRHVRTWRKLTGWQPSVKRQKTARGHPQGAVRLGLGRKSAAGASRVGHGTTPARPNADGRIDFSSRTVQVGGAFSLRGTRPATRSATGRAGALALACCGKLTFGYWPHGTRHRRRPRRLLSKPGGAVRTSQSRRAMASSLRIRATHAAGGTVVISGRPPGGRNGGAVGALAGVFRGSD